MELLQASRIGNAEAVKELLVTGSHLALKAVDSSGQTPLHLASFNGHIGVVRALLKRGYFKQEILDIINKGDLLGQTPLSLAAKGGHENIVRTLVAYDPTVDIESKNASGKTPLHVAVITDHVDVVHALVNLGANLEARDEEGKVPLARAIEMGLHEMARVLQTYKLKNLLFEAVISNASERVLQLIRAGANVNTSTPRGRHTIFSIGSTYRDTPLHLAAYRGYDGIVETLVENGASLESRNSERQTPLHVAASMGRENVVRTLIFAGADMEAKDKDGRMPDLARFPALSSIPVGEMNFPTLGDTDTRGKYFSMTEDIMRIILTKSDLHTQNVKPFNVSLDSDFSLEDNFGIVFRFGEDTIVSFSASGIAWKKATSPVCIGNGQVIYTVEQGGNENVYLDTIDLKGPMVRLCRELQTIKEKNWSVFDFDGTSGFIVYSVIPLRVFKFTKRGCYEQMFNVDSVYPNFETIERMWIPRRDSRGIGIFRGGSMGIPFGRRSGGPFWPTVKEFLFVGHVSLKTADSTWCFPDFTTQLNTNNPDSSTMYYMFFYTIKVENGRFSLSRISSCFQPPIPQIYAKVTFPVGISEKDGTVYVSYGLENKNCLLTTYLSEEVNVLLAPVSDWNEKNYVFHPKYALSILSGFDVWSSVRRPSGKMHLLGSIMATDGRFNPSISRIDDNTYMTVWRKFDGNIRDWIGVNSVSMEKATVEVVDSRLVYTRIGESITIHPGPSASKGEDPRILSVNNCTIMVVNDEVDDSIPKENRVRRMYIQNLTSGNNYYTFCHNISNTFEKNWGLFFVDGLLHFVYNVDPFTVGCVREESCPLDRDVEGCRLLPSMNIPSQLKVIFDQSKLHIRGGTPGIKVSDSEYLFVGHAVQGTQEGCFPSEIIQRYLKSTDDTWHENYPKLYTIFFYTIGKNGEYWELKRISCCSQLPGKILNQTKIVFPCGLDTADLDWENDGRTEKSFVVSYGEKDDAGILCAMTSNFLQFILRPVSEWNVNNYVIDINYFANIATLSPEFKLHNFVL